MPLIVPKVSVQPEIHFTHFPEFFAALDDKKHTFSFFARRGGTFHTKEGTSYHIPPNTFTSPWGNPVDEEIRLEVTEAYNKKELLVQDRPSIVGGKLMDLGFYTHLQFKGLSGIGLRQQKGIQCHFRPQSESVYQSWQLFRESAARTRSIDQVQSFEWAPGMQNLFWQRPGTPDQKVSFYIEETGPYAVGRLIPRKKRGAQAMLSVRLAGIPQPLDDCRVYLVYNTANTLVRLTPHRDKFTAFNLLRDQAANLLVMGIKAGDFFFYHSYLNQIDNQLLAVRPEKIGMTELARKLEFLNF
jgi:hypothetical protein